MLPLIAADINEDLIVRKVGGNPEIKLHLQDLGIVPGQIISLISVNDGNVIVKVKESRLAINKDMAMKIMI
ncbi:MAG: ferrous iron transport protein A [Clostridiales bacterium]|nr:ferrous iron transport protein A [Clostridiales bacterium]